MNFGVIKAGSWQRDICIVLALTTAIGPSLSAVAQTNDVKPVASPKVAAPADGGAQAPGAAAGAIDTTYIVPSAAAVIVLRPAQLMKSPMAEFLPVEVATAAGLKYAGIDPANIEQAVAFVDIANPSAPRYGLTLNFVQPIRGSDINSQLRAHTQPDKLGGKGYLKSQQPMLPSFFAPNNRTLVVAPDELLRQFVESPQVAKSGPMLDRLKNVPTGSDLYVALNITALRPLMMFGLAQSGEPIPPDAKPFLDALNLLDSAELTVNLSKAGVTSLVAHANDDNAAGKIESILADAAAKYQAKMNEAVAKQKTSEDPVERAVAQYTERVSGRWTKPFMPVREGSNLTFFHLEGGNSQQQQMVTIAVVGVLVALLLPATQAAREAARRSSSMNNMKQLMLALLNYESAKKTFPANAIYSADGKPLLSWRVQILPYIEEQALYNEFHLDEPWDSEHNRPLIARMPQVFANPSIPNAHGATNYLGVVGKECVFDGTDKGVKIRQITDGTSKTIMLVEADAKQAVIWTKPDDWKFDAKNPKAGLGTLHPGGWNAAFVDGSIQFISNNFPLGNLSAKFTKSGGEADNNPY